MRAVALRGFTALGKISGGPAPVVETGKLELGGRGSQLDFLTLIWKVHVKNMGSMTQDSCP
jgi:hypothetical protein